jgi:phosphatidylglycerol:prolipoprotein diacylglycerol transferase
MHPILFRIPLPKMPLKAWWALAAVAAIALVYAALGMRKKDRGTAGTAIIVAAGAGILGYVFRETKYEAPNLPIYSYGVMLGVSLVVGWYLTLTLAERDGLPKETMANCYVVTAIAAILGSRVLYVVTNPDEFKSFGDFFALRRGGLVAYGGFLGGYVGSWLFLQRHKIRLMPWADVAVPSLASGLLITRIGCYLFGCDFGKRLPEGAPGFLKKLGTFPKWSDGTLDGGGGSPAFVKHLEAFRGTPLGDEIRKNAHSLPVHPTQIYESLVGLGLLALLLWQRKNQKFRGQIFFLFAFGYGYLRFVLEILRDDTERGEFGPSIPEHWFISLALLALAVAFTFGISLGIKDERMRTAARIASFIPPVAAFVMLKPASFGKQTNMQFSTSQWVGLLSALICSYFYAKFWETARKSPKVAMSLETLGDIKAKPEDLAPRKKGDDDEDEDEEKEQEEEAPKKKKGKKKKTREAGVDEERTPLPVDKEEEKDDEKDADDKIEAKDDKPEAAPGSGETAKAKDEEPEPSGEKSKDGPKDEKTKDEKSKDDKPKDEKKEPEKEPA